MNIVQLFISLGFSQLLIAAKLSKPADAEMSNPLFGNNYWIVESSTIHPALDLDMDGKPDTDVLILQEPCDRDDADLFRADGVILTDWGNIRCDEEEEGITETGTWKFNPQKQILTIKKDHSRKLMEAKLIQKTSNQLTFTAHHKSSKSEHVITLKLKRKL
ncbi:hypothetical protein ACFRAE_06665 [Sphingobacterium sp. HJSM2_6]|uniref:hypothetical protein n=1 Tax=Sphingobacterium sp. HJSM2_6 TaxID=3366264 RepID=UPI003BBF9E58